MPRRASPRPCCSAIEEEIPAYDEDEIAKWRMPEDVVIVEEIPHTATGKIQKTTLRDYELPTA